MMHQPDDAPNPNSLPPSVQPIRAHYPRQPGPELENNPLILALPRVKSDEEWLEQLTSLPAFEEYHYGYWSPKQLLERLYGHTGVLAVPDLPSHLGLLAHSTDETWHLTADDLAMSHTLVGYYTYFRGEQVRREVLQQVHGRAGGLHVRLGVCAGSAVSPGHFRLCAACRQEDLRTYGETYWHRSHHLPGLLVCDRHGEVLLESQVPYRSPGRHEHVAVPHDLADTGLRPLAGVLQRPEAARRVAMRSAALLGAQVRRGGELPDYRMALGVCGFDAGRGGGSRLRDAFRAHFGDDLLAASFRADAGRDGLSWLDDVLRRPRRPMHPYRHVLMEALLDAHLGRHRESTDAVERKEGRRWCLYEDAGLRQEASAMAEQGFRTHAIARALDVDWKTADRLLSPLKGRHAPCPKDPSIDRDAWSALAGSHPEAGKKRLRLMAPALYARLYRNDREWLRAFRSKAAAPRPKRRVDWAERDAELESQVRCVVAVVLAEEPLKRASRNCVLGRLGKRALLAHKAAHLPRAVAALDELCESTEAFQVRRLVAVLGHEASSHRLTDSQALWQARVGTSRMVDCGARLVATARARVQRLTASAGDGIGA